MRRIWLLLLSFAACLMAADGFEPGDVLRFAADGGLREVAVAARSSATTYIGSLDGYSGSLNAMITKTADGWAMDIDDWHTRRVLHVVNASGGMSVSVKDKRSRRGCRTKRVPSASVSGDGKAFSKVVSGLDITAGWSADPVTNEVDILIVFDKTAVSWLNENRRSTDSFAERQVAKMNAVLANSGLADYFKVSLRGVFEANFDVTRDCGSDSYERLGVAVDRAIKGTSAIWKSIRDERDRLGADVVVILANSQPNAKTIEDIYGTVGVSYGLEYDCARGLYGWNKAAVDECRDSAYGACDIRVVEIDNTFSHEVGHMLGAGHSDRLSPRYSQPGPQLFLYSAALMYKDSVDKEHYYTVMGYDSTDGGWFTPTYVEIPYYSSPKLYHPVTGSVLGDLSHDNVRTIMQTYDVVSQYRVRTDATASDPNDEKDDAVSGTWLKSRVLKGAAYSADDAIGLFELKCGRVNSKGVAKVSAVFTGLSGKKVRYRAQQVNVQGLKGVSLTLGEGADAVDVSIIGDGFTGRRSSDGAYLKSTVVGGDLKSATPKVSVPKCDFAAEGKVVDELLPTVGEPIIVNAGRWSFAKAASVKVAKDKGSEEYRLVIDESNGRTNRSAMKLTYSAKSGLFKGSFRIYSLVETADGRKKLKKYTSKVTGMVVDGCGYGQATVKNPASGPWPVNI